MKNSIDNATIGRARGGSIVTLGSLSVRRLNRLLLWFAIMLAVGVIFLLAAYALLMFYPSRSDARLSIYLLSLLGVILLSSVIYDVVHKKFDLFEAKNFVLLVFFYYYFVCPVRFVIEPEFLQPPYDAMLSEGVAWSIIGLLFYMLGYSIGLGRKSKAFSPLLGEDDWNKTKTVIFVAFLFTLAIIGIAVFADRAGGISNIISTPRRMRSTIRAGSPYFYFLTYYLLIGTLILYASMIGSGKIRIRKIFIICVCMAGILVTSFVMSGSRRNVIVMLITMVVFWHYYKKRMTTGKIIGAFGLIVCLFMFFGIIRAFMHDLDRVFELTRSAVERAPTSELLYTLMAGNVYRMFLVLLSNVPESYGFLWGSSYYRLLFVGIPRAIWSGKPKNISQMFPELMMPEYRGRNIVTSVTLLGEMYWNFSFVGIILGMFLFGILSKVLYRYLMKNKENKGAVLIYAVTVCYFMELFRGTFHTTTLLYLATMLLPLLVFLGYTKRRAILAVISKGPQEKTVP